MIPRSKVFESDSCCLNNESSTMAIQAQTSSPQSNSSFSSDNSVVLESCGKAGSEESHAPKIRKPYTITKQRERWTEEEHKKFIEALKLHGRAWRKTEEHVGTKTAVQIRSHAQKFFSKVVREPTNTNVTSDEPIKIPPPRPKRKPTHPYPRKLVPLPTKEYPIEDRAGSTSPDSSLSEQETDNQRSPTSVISTIISESSRSGLGDSTPNSSTSPVCSTNEINLTESTPGELVSVKLELFPNTDPFDKQRSDGVKILKLFGKDVVVQQNLLQEPQEDLKSLDISLATNGNSWKEFKSGIDHKAVDLSLGLETANNEPGSVDKRFLTEEANEDKTRKGFVPYKRCFSETEMTNSSGITKDENTGQRIRVCL